MESPEGAKDHEPVHLRDFDLKPEYNTEDDDIVRDFYHPCLKVSTAYDRAVGYFRANIYRELGEDLLDFVIRGGKVRIVCSPDIPEPDEEAVREGYDLRGRRSSKEQETSLIHVMNAMAGNPKESDCLDMLRLLIERGSLDLLIAMRTGGIYHRKVGAFYDSTADFVAFAGSGNETERAVSSVEDWSNDEEFDVFKSWGDAFESRKARKKADYLSHLLSGGTEHTRVRPLNQVERDFLAQFRKHKDLESCREGARERAPFTNVSPEFGSGFSLYYFQQLAVDAWTQAGRVGLVCMPTGTGKTLTALFAIRELVQQGQLVAVVVPSKILLDQWLEALRAFYPGVPILAAGAGFNWKSNELKQAFIFSAKRPRIILATMKTAATDDFREFLAQGQTPALVVDEAHRLGSPTYRRVMDIGFREKLGLSATPERLFDREGSDALEAFFGATPVYDLRLGAKVKLSEYDPQEVPIIGHFLARYEYGFEKVELASEEQEQWKRLTEEIKRLIARDPSVIENGMLARGMNKRLQYLLIRRSRIVKNAEAKVGCASRVILERYPRNGHWIVYCDNQRQLASVAARIRTCWPASMRAHLSSRSPRAATTSLGANMWSTARSRSGPACRLAKFSNNRM